MNRVDEKGEIMENQELLAKFEEAFGSGGDIRIYFAPGRVNLIGEHTDMCFHVH